MAGVATSGGFPLDIAERRMVMGKAERLAALAYQIAAAAMIDQRLASVVRSSMSAS